jgi:hypothetical protein
MKSPITKPEFSQPVGATAVYLFDDWFDPIEAQVRVRGFIHATRDLRKHRRPAGRVGTAARSTPPLRSCGSVIRPPGVACRSSLEGPGPFLFTGTARSIIRMAAGREAMP